ncbi:MAG: sensor histidine kinase [Propionibacteriales bacterium]|nr:sensor histidine kinase [Propionibacteriales bacterium]
MTWVRSPVVQFLAACLLTLVVVVLATGALSRSAADGAAIDQARGLTAVLGRSVAEPEIPRGLVDGKPGAIDRFDRRALDRLLVEDVLRIKIWSADGTILYSDRTELIGSSYALGDEELDVLRDGGADAELSDLARPENRFERSLGGDLLEVYTRIESPEGDPLLFEAYFSVDQIQGEREAILDRFLPITLGALAALVLAATPLILLLNRRVGAAARERERLLRIAVRSSDAERLRIARDLHDGVVQDLAGSSFALSTLSSRADSPALADELEDVSRSLRTSMRALRSLLVEIYPPDLHAAGLSAALTDLVAPLVATGLEVDLDVTGDADASEAAVALVWRVAQEGVRNVARHAHASRMSVTVHAEQNLLVLEVVDDGRGFDPGAEISTSHLGLRGLDSLVRDASGTLVVQAAAGSGTTLRMEVPRQ